MSHITVTPHKGKVRVLFNGAVIAESAAALDLKEGSYGATLYVPRQDANMALFSKTSHHTTCPYKGVASYYTLNAGGTKGDNVVWSYETPKSDVAAIKDHLAFYLNKGVSVEEI